MTQLLSSAEYLLFVTLTNYLAVLAGVTLWGSFFLLGLIAQRLEQAFEIPTHWRLLLWAPSGILLYTVYTLVSAGSGPGNAAGFALERQIAYGALLVSGALCLWGSGASMLALARLMAARRREPAG